MAAPESTKIQVTFDGRSTIPMVNIYAQSPDEAEILHEWVSNNFADLIDTSKQAHAAGVVMASIPTATVSSAPAAAQAAPVAPAAVAPDATPAGHMCDCGIPMRLRSSSFGQFYSCSKNMSDPTRCNKKVNVG